VKIWPTHCKACGQAIQREDEVCVACGEPISQEPFESDAVHASSVPLPSFAGYAESKPAKTHSPRGKSKLPILELLVAVLLVVGAVTAIWILRATLPGKSATGASLVEVTISPQSARLSTGKTLEFAATVSGAADADVNWRIEEGDAGGRVVSHGAKAEAGKVSSVAVYTAPKKPGTYHLVASNKADPGKSATAAIAVVKR
jgi:hypothetical protein